MSQSAAEVYSLLSGTLKVGLEPAGNSYDLQRGRYDRVVLLCARGGQILVERIQNDAALDASEWSMNRCFVSYFGEVPLRNLYTDELMPAFSLLRARARPASPSAIVGDKMHFAELDAECPGVTNPILISQTIEKILVVE